MGWGGAPGRSAALCGCLWGSCRHVGAHEGPIPVSGPMGVLSSMGGSMGGPVTCVGAHGGRNTHGSPHGGPVTVWGPTRGGPIAMWMSMGSLSPIWVPLRVLVPMWVLVGVPSWGLRGTCQVTCLLLLSIPIPVCFLSPSSCPGVGLCCVPPPLPGCVSLCPPLPGAGGGAEVLGTVAGGLGAGGCGPCLH